VIELQDGSIFHLELQTYPDKKMPFRMLEYWTLLKQRYPGRKVRQMVLYVGGGTSGMKSSQLEDKIPAVLCNVEEPERYFNELMEELLKLPEKERADYIRKLLTALYYKPKLKMVLKSLLEEKKMPLTITEEMIKQDPFFQEGLERGIKKGKLEAQREAILNLYKELNLPAEKIAKILKVPEEFVKEVIKKENR